MVAAQDLLASWLPSSPSSHPPRRVVGVKVSSLIPLGNDVAVSANCSPPEPGHPWLCNFLRAALCQWQRQKCAGSGAEPTPRCPRELRAVIPFGERWAGAAVPGARVTQGQKSLRGGSAGSLSFLPCLVCLHSKLELPITSVGLPFFLARLPLVSWL